jgi:hypothetical protein
VWLASAQCPILAPKRSAEVRRGFPMPKAKQT